MKCEHGRPLWFIGCNGGAAFVILAITLACAAPAPRNPRHVYLLDHATVNNAACDVEGADARSSSSRRLSINEQSYDGAMPHAIVSLCDTDAECIVHTDGPSTSYSNWTLQQDNADSYSASLVAFQGMCMGQIEDRHLQFTGMGASRTVRFEIRRTSFVIPDGTPCNDASARTVVAAGSAVCNFLEVFGGTFDADIEEASYGGGGSSGHH